MSFFTCPRIFCATDNTLNQHRQPLSSSLPKVFFCRAPWRVAGDSLAFRYSTSAVGWLSECELWTWGQFILAAVCLIPMCLKSLRIAIVDEWISVNCGVATGSQKYEQAHPRGTGRKTYICPPLYPSLQGCTHLQIYTLSAVRLLAMSQKCPSLFPRLILIHSLWNKLCNWYWGRRRACYTA